MTVLNILYWFITTQSVITALFLIFFVIGLLLILIRGYNMTLTEFLLILLLIVCGYTAFTKGE